MKLLADNAIINGNFADKETYMKNLGVNEVRDMFRDFFVSKDHYPGGSSSLIPRNDKSLLIINSGMAPLKPYFAGTETPPKKRMTTCQKCIRTNDIENVGKTARHGTFFEMLGNFSFGDYFKKESLQWGWEFCTEWLEMPKDKLWATIYENDDEAFEIWRDVIGMPEERIIRLGKDDNFWEIGLGPCGPCSIMTEDRSGAAESLTASRAATATDILNSGITCSHSLTDRKTDLILGSLILTSIPGWVSRDWPAYCRVSIPSLMWIL